MPFMCSLPDTEIQTVSNVTIILMFKSSVKVCMQKVCCSERAQKSVCLDMNMLLNMLSIKMMSIISSSKLLSFLEQSE